MATVFLSMIASTGAGLAVTTALAVYAQRNWRGAGRGAGADEAA